MSCHTEATQERKNAHYAIQLAPCMDPDWSSEERRGVDFFLRATVFKVITLSRDAVFWRETVPRLTGVHPAFRHLVVAISSTHELLFDEDPDKLNVFAMMQCNKATRLLRSSGDLEVDMLLASCILVSAYSLLRCDLVSADRSIESGLLMAAQPGGALREDLKRILFMLGRHNGFKIWAPDINYQFEKSHVASESFFIENGSVNGPFVDTGQVLAAYRTLTVEVVAKVMRNLARGAYVDPHCSLALEITRQLGLFTFYFEQYSAQIPSQHTDTRMELTQLRLGFYVTYLLFHTKVISPKEQTFDAHLDICHKVVELADEILTARHAGQSVKYIDRIVNVALLSFGFSCRNSLLRRRAIAFLQGQWRYEDGLVHYLRGVVLCMVDVVEAREIGVEGCDDSQARRRPTMVGLRCREDDKMICLEYTTVSSGERREEWFEWDTSLGATFSAQDINSCLQGIMAGYRMYGKPTMSQAPRGYVREMYFHGRPVPVYWGPGCGPLD